MRKPGRRAGAPLLALALVVASAGSALAGPRATGWLDTADASGGAGWAYDPGAGATPIAVHVYVDGRLHGATTADRPRPDLVAAGAAPEANHGFVYSFAGLAPGSHRVDAYAISTTGVNPKLEGSGKTVVVGGTVSPAPVASAPTGWLDAASASGGAGWAYDPALGGMAVTVHVHVDGQLATVVTADQPRPDLVTAGAAPEAGHGFSFALPGLAAGPHVVEAYAIGPSGSSTRLSGSGRIATGAGTASARCGAVELLTASGELRGYAFDPAQGGVTVEVWADGRRQASGATFGGSVWANGAQPSALGANTRFEWVAPNFLRDGRRHRLFVYSTDAAGQNPLELAGSGQHVLETWNANLGDLTLAGSEVQVRTSARFGGACTGITWNGLQFVNNADHGRQCQSAWTFGYGERLNPTEAGSGHDGTGPTRSVVVGASVAGSTLTTTSHAAFWDPPGTTSPNFGGTGTVSALNGSEVSADLFTKTVTVDAGGDPHLIRWVNEITLFADAPTFIGELPTPYVDEAFSAFYTFDPATGALAPLDHTPAQANGWFPPGAAAGEQALPVILATANGSHAIGIYSPEAGATYGRFDFRAFGRTSKSNVVVRRSNVPGGLPLRLTSYVAVGTLDQVQASLSFAARTRP